MKTIFDIHILFQNYAEVKTAEETVKLISFGGSCKTEYFTGEVLPGGVDVQTLFLDTTGKVSACYILKGVDADNHPCKVFIENEGDILEDGSMHTTPKVITDSEALKWLNTAALKCRFASVGEEFHVILYVE